MYRKLQITQVLDVELHLIETWDLIVTCEWQIIVTVNLSFMSKLRKVVTRVNQRWLSWHFALIQGDLLHKFLITFPCSGRCIAVVQMEDECGLRWQMRVQNVNLTWFSVESTQNFKARTFQLGSRMLHENQLQQFQITNKSFKFALWLQNLSLLPHYSRYFHISIYMLNR